MGGPIGFGLRRELVDEAQRPKPALTKGERPLQRQGLVRRRGQVNDIASVTLLGIEAGPNADMAEIRRIVAGSAFSGMNPTQAP